MFGSRLLGRVGTLGQGVSRGDVGSVRVSPTVTAPKNVCRGQWCWRWLSRDGNCGRELSLLELGLEAC